MLTPVLVIAMGSMYQFLLVFVFAAAESFFAKAALILRGKNHWKMICRGGLKQHMRPLTSTFS